MEKVIGFFQTWGILLLAFLSFVLGGGWLKLYLEFRREKKEWERQRYQGVLDDFLHPLGGILEEVHRIFDELQDDLGLRYLEYHPEGLKNYFESLPNDDPRKLLWKVRIKRLIAMNKQAVELIRRFRGRMILPDFDETCHKFEYNAQKWEDLFSAAEESGPNVVHGKLGKPVVEYFPPDFEPYLQAEIAEVRRRANLQ